MMYAGFGEGVRKIWNIDGKAQAFYLNNIGKDVRNLPLEAFKKYDAFFVPNDRYIGLYFGCECQQLHYGLYYSNGQCTVCNHVVFPFYNLVGQVVGWVSYKPFVHLKSREQNDFTTPYYEYPSALIFNKGRYVFMLPSVYKSALRDGYIVITDGVFDAVNFTHCGINACSVLGSKFNIWLAFYFKFIERVFVSIDNDTAGHKLYRDIQRFIPNARRILQVFGKDADEVLKTCNGEDFLHIVKTGVERNTDIVFRKKISSVV